MSVSRESKKVIIIALSVVILAISFVLSLMLGAEHVSPAAVFGFGDKFDNIILWKLRLPRSLLVLITGILLGGSGAVFQLFFRNPLAEPGVMGISSGATLGAVIASVFFGKIASSLPVLSKIAIFISPVNCFAFITSLFAGLFVTFLAYTKAGRNSSIMLLLCGTALGTLYSSASSLVLLTCNKELRSVYTWILGSFNGRGWNELFFILIPSFISLIIMFIIARPLDLLSGGEKSALSLGVEVDGLRILVLISGALAVSCSVCAGGTIGFVGLIAPHIVRKIVGPKGKVLIPLSMFFGGALLLLSDTFARIIIAPAEIPAGVITGILGVPFFLALCLKNQKS